MRTREGDKERKEGAGGKRDQPGGDQPGEGGGRREDERPKHKEDKRRDFTFFQVHFK